MDRIDELKHQFLNNKDFTIENSKKIKGLEEEIIRVKRTSDKKIRYSLKFNKMLGYSATWREGDRQVIIDELKKSCLEMMKKTLKYLSELPDDKLIEILEEQEYDE